MRRFLGFAIAALILGLAASPAQAQLGLAIGGVGPINRSMGGAAVAAPLDAPGALYWNPATIAFLGRSEMSFGMELLIPRTTLSSRIAAGTLGPTQTTPLSGTSGGNNGVFALPTVGLVYQPEDSPIVYGLGVFAIGGFGVNYAASRTNPVLMPQFPYGGGLGNISAQYQVIQFAPTVAMKLTEQFSIGIQANIDMGNFSANPAVFSQPTILPNSLSPRGVSPNYPAAVDGRMRGGGGFQIGAYYVLDPAWNFGAAVKSPQWFDTYTYNAVTVNGHPASPSFNLNFPMTVSVGTAYTGIDRLLVALDFRFLDYRDTAGFGGGGFNKLGMLQGLAWQNVFALALGTQYQVTDTLAVRAGYTFALDPVGNAVTSYNIGSPTIIQNSLALGASYDVSTSLKFSLAYVHFFQNSNTGPILAAGSGTPIPGSSVHTAATGDSVVFGASVSF